jgi:hypothetical protein
MNLLANTYCALFVLRHRAGEIEKQGWKLKGAFELLSPLRVFMRVWEGGRLLYVELSVERFNLSTLFRCVVAVDAGWFGVVIRI